LRPFGRAACARAAQRSQVEAGQALLAYAAVILAFIGGLHQAG
jgi:hypothetical protein